MKREKSPFGRDGMFRMAHPVIFDNARQLRKKMTHAEILMWGYLKVHFPGVKFRRQHPMGLFILDFYCHRFQLAIEVDGEIHENPEIMERDKMKEEFLKEKNIYLIRFKNWEVLHYPEKIVQKLKQLIPDLKSGTLE